MIKIASDANRQLHVILPGIAEDPDILPNGDPVIGSFDQHGNLDPRTDDYSEFFAKTLLEAFDTDFIEKRDEEKAVEAVRGYFQELRRLRDASEDYRVPGTELTVFMEELLLVGNTYGKTGSLDPMAVKI